MIDATLYQVGRNARTQDFDSGHRRAQKKSIKSAMRSCTVEKRRNLGRRSTGFVDFDFSR
jgi:hypothetical protein